ncbi:MAG: TonB-dependent receptor [Melioribacteraceae bacterium]|nr:TonB-dependent receptor [Melioribacteraceae bacterium]
MHLKIFITCFIVFSFLTISSSIFAAPSGKIVGTVTDANTDEKLIGANISVQGTALGAATNMEGEYRIANIPVGSQTLKISYIGYKDTLLIVNIVENRTLTVDVELNLDVIQGEDVVVTAQLEGQLAAINRQLQSNKIKNVVSKERILSLPDVNAAESIGRLPGVSIIRSGGEASQVVIRGLAPAYNSITVNGEKIPSTSLNDRGVDLGMISPEVLAGIEVTKALTADMEADAIGGTVNLLLSNAPSGFKYNIRTMGGYNNIRNDFNQFNGYISLSNRFADDKFGLMVTGNRTRVQRGSDRFSANYEVVGPPPEGEIYNKIDAAVPRLIYTDDIRERSSFSIFMDYKFSNSVINFSNFFSRVDKDQDIRTSGFNYGTNSDNSFRADYRKRITQSDVMTTQLSGLHTLGFGDIDWRLARNVSNTRILYDSQFNFRDEGAVDAALLPQEDISADNIIKATTIDLTDLALFGSSFRQEESFDRDLTATLNFKVPFAISNSFSGYLQFGGRYFAKNRVRDRSLYRPAWTQLVSDNKIQIYHSRWGEPGFVFHENSTGNPSVLNYLSDNLSLDDFLNGAYEFYPELDGEELTRLFDSYMRDTLYNKSIREDLDDYEVDEEVTSSYVMTEINIGKYLMFLPGVRYEYTNNNLTGRKGQSTGTSIEDSYFERESRISDTTAINTYGNFFPMIHLRFKPVDWFDVRLAYTETISRPRMEYMLPRKILESNRITIFMGKSDLKPQLSTNYDLFFSFYGNRAGLLTLGGFYKEISNLIFTRNNKYILNAEAAEKEGLTENFVGWFLNRPENNESKTIIKGFEIEWQTNFHYLPKPFNGFVLTLNYSQIWSQTNYPRSRLIEERIPTFPFRKLTALDTVRSGRMINQPDAIANISLGYDLGRFSGRISMLYQGSTLSSISSLPEDDGFTDELLRFDLSFKYWITDNISLFFAANNITNRVDATYLFGRGNPRNYPTSSQYYGYTLDFGIGISN